MGFQRPDLHLPRVEHLTARELYDLLVAERRRRPRSWRVRQLEAEHVRRGLAVPR